MPWSVKAQSLLLHQYAAVGAASCNALTQSVALLQQAAAHGMDMGNLFDTYQHRRSLAQRYVEAYHRYCWPVHSINDLKLAPFHLLATQGHTYFDRDHSWHMQTLAGFCQADQQLLLATPHLVVDVTDPSSIEESVHWWEHLTGRGGEGMVVKPLEFVAQGRHGTVQPAIKCRGPEYLRIIYGPEYDVPENLERLRARGLRVKRSLAMRRVCFGRRGVGALCAWRSAAARA